MHIDGGRSVMGGRGSKSGGKGAGRSSGTISTPIAGAYEVLRARNRRRYQFLSEIAEQAGVPVEKAHSWALAEARSGRGALSEGDWSLSTPQQRSGVLMVDGKKMTLFGLIN